MRLASKYIQLYYIFFLHELSKYQKKFHSIDMEDHTYCKYDRIQIYDGGNEVAPLMGKFCGTAIPPELESSKNQLFLKMLTDESNAERGFNATYESECGGQLYAEATTGFIYSHAYYGDRKYEKSTKCQWEIVAETGMKVKLLFTQFSLEPERTCEYDFVLVYDGHKSENKKSGPFCGFMTIDTIVTETSRVFIEFQTDDTVEEKGFVIEYTATQPISERKLLKLSAKRPAKELIIEN